MSGIVGIVNFVGEPIDRALLSRMTASLDFRGPDARRTWIAEPAHESGTNPCVGFGHTLLRTTYEAEHEQQPFTLDGQTWIVADCRVDAREELLAKLRAKGRDASLRLPDASLQRPDVELILHAWHVWGEECVEHLLGDFAFAIWDAPRRRLFCARDHMGVKPFYYAHIGSTLIFSNTLDCVRMHPAVSDKLNDLAIADFILFGSNQEKETTSFADIQRLPSAHAAIWTAGTFDIRRYWLLPIEEPVYYRHDRDYTDRFLELLRQAVSDRLRTPTVSVFMSGGLDSPALAAVAQDLLRDGNATAPVRAFTSVFDSLMPDSERHYASLAAQHMGIPIQFFAVDGDTAWAKPDSRRLPEPRIDLPVDATIQIHQYNVMAAHSRVAFYGEGPDNALSFDWRSHLSWLASQKRWGRLARDMVKHMREHKRIPLLSSLPGMFSARRMQKSWAPSFPDWLNEDLVQRLDLDNRWNRPVAEPSPRHPARNRGYTSLIDPLWQNLFEGLEPPYTNAPMELRHPYVDVRLLSFMLQVPAVPWCRKKQLLRRAFRGKLPEAVLNRPKTALAKMPEFERARLLGSPPLLPSGLLASYGCMSRWHMHEQLSMGSFNIGFRFAALSYWLQSCAATNRMDLWEDYESRTYASA